MLKPGADMQKVRGISGSELSENPKNDVLNIQKVLKKLSIVVAILSRVA